MSAAIEHIRFQRHNAGWIVYDQQYPDAVLECAMDEKALAAAIVELRRLRNSASKKPAVIAAE